MLIENSAKVHITHRAGNNQLKQNIKPVKDLNLPRLTNSEELLVLPALLGSSCWFNVLIDERLPWECIVLFSISPALVLQKLFDLLDFFTDRFWTLSPFDDASIAIIVGGLAQHPKQPLLCYKSGFTADMISTSYQYFDAQMFQWR